MSNNFLKRKFLIINNFTKKYVHKKIFFHSIFFNNCIFSFIYFFYMAFCFSLPKEPNAFNIGADYGIHLV